MILITKCIGVLLLSIQNFDTMACWTFATSSLFNSTLLKHLCRSRRACSYTGHIAFKVRQGLRVFWVCVCSYVVFWYKIFFAIKVHCNTKGTDLCPMKGMNNISTYPWRVMTGSGPLVNTLKSTTDSIERILPPFYYWVKNLLHDHFFMCKPVHCCKVTYLSMLMIISHPKKLLTRNI